VFATADGNPFPAELALAGPYDALVDGNDIVFTGQNHTISVRIQWPGYDGWAAQVRIVTYQGNPEGITRAKLVKEVSKRLRDFIKKMESIAIDPTYAEYRVGPGGIELRSIHIAALEQVSRGSWQPRLIYGG